MRRWMLSLVAAMAFAPWCAWGQAGDLKSAAPVIPNGMTQEQRGRQLLDEMVAALGGEAWLGRKDMHEEGHLARFFQGAPTGEVVHTYFYRRFPGAMGGERERLEFGSPKGFLPGEVRDIVQVWTGDGGYEISYKGKTPLPPDQVADYMRRRAHSLEEVVRTWVKKPGVMVVSEGTTMVERRMADKFTVLSADNDAVTIELDANTHLPLRRSFEWRNETYKDHDKDAEEYDGYHDVEGVQTPLTVTRYHNGEMADQRFLNKVEYNRGLAPSLFDPDLRLSGKPRKK